jgi:biotin operon repressor
MKLARHYQALLDTGRFESRAALARHLGVSRTRVTQVLSSTDADFEVVMWRARGR